MLRSVYEELGHSWADRRQWQKLNNKLTSSRALQLYMILEARGQLMRYDCKLHLMTQITFDKTHETSSG